MVAVVAGMGMYHPFPRCNIFCLLTRNSCRSVLNQHHRNAVTLENNLGWKYKVRSAKRKMRMEREGGSLLRPNIACLSILIQKAIIFREEKVRSDF